MTLKDLNNSLEQLASNQDRDSIINFAFALMNWIGVEPNSGSIPQLLAPKTQKLKDYLENAPKTIQPQLYRLSNDNQPIRVRFAVLKKVKKEYISQLVDNDPGAESYQNTPAPLRVITKAPYFVHFVTTPAYDKLVLIFNQGDQKRVVSFRNRLTNTQYNKIIQQWQGISSKNKTEIADIFWKSLDIKEVNKEFYKQIKERFDALIGIVRTQSSNSTENQVKQFTVRLIGRYIFCWFLKEKGIISQELIGKKSIEATKNFYQNVLLKLFFETLNTKVQDRNALTHEKLFEKIPYLNGGLFDESDEDRLFRDLKLDDWLRPFIAILESYDFTVDESSSQYQQVAVDPEMLGRIFENLLASQNEETEKIANQRKAFGAFYTPREIVDYMVNESIKAYMASKLNIKDDELISVFSANPVWPDKLKAKKGQALKAIESIKILDPACGSGAFPMGILHKLVEIHELLGTVKSSYELKKDILSQNIYGVDIMPMAIEIARLRAWLSLILEEDYKPNDPKHNFGVKPLPNLDFKFVCANSLIDSGFDKLYLKYIADDKIPRAESMLNLAKEIPNLIEIKNQYFDAALHNKSKDEIVGEYEAKKEQIKSNFITLRRNFKEVNSFIENIDKWDPFDESQVSPFFSATWMFGIEKGFDIVIGNPPYVRQETAKLDKKYFQQNFASFSGKSDIYVFFYEQGFNLLKKGGILTYITSSKFIKAGYGKPLLSYMADKTQLRSIIDFNDLPVFNGITTYPVVVTAFKEILDDYSFQYYNLLQLPDSSLQSLLDVTDVKLLSKKQFITSDYKFIANDHSSLIERIKLNSIRLEEYCGSPIVGIKTGFNEGYEVDPKTSNSIDYIFGRDIKRYSPVKAENRIVFPYDEKYKLIPFEKLGTSARDFLAKNKLKLSARAIINEGIESGSKQWYEYQQINKTIKITESHIIYPNVSLGNNFSIAKDVAIDMTAFVIRSDSHFLLGVLNSKLTEYLMKIWGIERRGGYVEYKSQYVENLPIRLNASYELAISKNVAEIIKRKSKKLDTKQLEKNVDHLVYQLYNLNLEEVKIIDPEFDLSKTDYDNIKLI